MNLELSIMTNAASLADLHDAKLRQATQDIFNAYAAIDTSAGALAYAMYQAQQLFTALDRNETLDNYANFAQYAEKRIGVKRAQAFNLAKAGSFMRVVRVQNGKSVRKVFLDKWTFAKGKFKSDGTVYESVPKSLSNTVILVLARYCNVKDEDVAIEREKRVYDLMMNGTITADLSVSAVDKILNPPVIETTGTETTPNEGEATPNDSETTPNEGETPPNEGENPPAEFIEFRLGKTWVENTLIPELLHFMDKSVAITELVTKLRYEGKSAQ